MYANAFAAPNFSGRYTMWVFGTKVYADVNQQGKKISGVAWFYDFWRKKITFHFNGYYDKGKVYASHHSGHVFRGRVVNNNRLVGVITTKDGLRIPVDTSTR
jgi:hypothetical protein